MTDGSVVMETRTSITTNINGNTPLVKVCGDLDYFTEDKFRNAVKSFMDKGCKDIIIDMSEVTFMDSGGMAALVYAIKLLSVQQGRLWLADCNDRVMHKMQIAGFLHLADTVNFTVTVDTALSAIGDPGSKKR